MNRLELNTELTTFLSSSKKPLLVIMGATASGKTKLAVELASRFNGEVINADSRQIYQEIEVGNALTKPEEMQGIPHHLFSTIPLSEPISVAEYKDMAEEAIADIQRRGKLPILCGGTMMWIDAVVENFTIPPTKANVEFRKMMENESIDELLSRLNLVDPESAEKLMNERNKRYIIRALEIFEQTGSPKSKISGKGKRLFQVFKIAPEVPREELYRRINERTKHQLEHGMLEEVQKLVDRYGNGVPQSLADLNWPGLSSIGCKEVIPYLKGEITQEQLLMKLQQNNRNYAKRQLTWLRKDREVNWIQL
jgi:tRNA dimethylallyltransferase